MSEKKNQHIGSNSTPSEFPAPIEIRMSNPMAQALLGKVIHLKGGKAIKVTESQIKRQQKKNLRADFEEYNRTQQEKERLKLLKEKYGHGFSE